MNRDELEQLCSEIRDLLVQTVSHNGGHLASNLGVVELTVALHRVFNSPSDPIIFDVGHQCYTHKILTGRKDNFVTLRTEGGISGFTRPDESEHDIFSSGHSSTAISQAIGLAKAKALRGEKGKVIAVIGDGAMTGGLAYEALNNSGTENDNLIVILNDNNMSISKNVGALAKNLTSIRTSRAYFTFKSKVEHFLSRIPKVGSQLCRFFTNMNSAIRKRIYKATMFEDMGFRYYGPIDGHDLRALTDALTVAKAHKHSVLIHVNTVKGMGYRPAEKNPTQFHGIGKFDVNTGEPLSKGETFSSVFGNTVCDFAAKDARICCVTAAMAAGTGLTRFASEYPQRFFDVGIAEAHAVTFSAGLAAGGLKPVFAVYSSFLQRAYDQILHDVCIQQLHVVFAIDRAGLVGSDGETHQGIFDLSYLSNIPNMTVFAPKNAWELEAGLEFGLEECNGPFALRYPRGTAVTAFEEFKQPIVYGEAEVMYYEKDIALLAVGSMVETADIVRKNLKAQGYSVTLINARFVKPIDESAVFKCGREHNLIVTMEENVISGGFGESVCQLVSDLQLPVRVLNISLPDDYIEHGSVDILRCEAGIDAETVTERIISFYENIVL